ncbi:hypothetical protein Maes01_01867 [Microbulbifer aestuariivivens]|uniref:HTH merR-type domain-containing protein n=1 Tax=Microbulbifer aestuariivivens TaxID=1908308 RepID=A0ABP9WQ22_9GAMM
MTTTTTTTTTMRIGALAAATGVPASTIRYYEQIGLLPGVTRSEGGSRRYPDEAILRLQMIRALQALGFTLEQMQVFFQPEGQAPEHEQVLATINGQLASLQALIASLRDKHRTLTEVRALLERAWASGRCATDDELRALLGSVAHGPKNKAE